MLGHWGAGPFDNDYAADARNDYDDLIATGLSIEDAMPELQAPKFMTVLHLPEVLRGPPPTTESALGTCSWRSQRTRGKRVNPLAG